ncbi:hypothetical protein GQ457_16G008010 [Hibiscus cannabinus]
MNVIDRASYDSGGEAKLIWINARDGAYSTKVFCAKASTVDSMPDKIWKIVWAGIVPPKVEGFVWKVLQGRVPTLVDLAKRGISRSSSNLCVLCSREVETIEHLFFCHCEVVWRVWKRWVALWHLQVIPPLSTPSFGCTEFWSDRVNLRGDSHQRSDYTHRTNIFLRQWPPHHDTVL